MRLWARAYNRKMKRRKGEGRDMIVSLVEYCSLPCVRQCTCGGVYISSLSLMRCVCDGVYVPCNWEISLVVFMYLVSEDVCLVVFMYIPCIWWCMSAGIYVPCISPYAGWASCCGRSEPLFLCSCEVIWILINLPPPTTQVLTRPPFVAVLTIVSSDTMNRVLFHHRNQCLFAH